MVGDFDSSDQTLIDKYSHVPREVFPSDKDMTDSALLVKEHYKRVLKVDFVRGFGRRAK